MKHLFFFVCVVIVSLAAAALPAAETAPPPRRLTDRDALFRKDQVLELKIEVGKEALQALNREPRKYVKATLIEGSTEYVDIGLHLKGAAGSFRNFDDKPGLTLNMDKYVDGQRFHGLDKWHLANSVQDPSYLTELLCGEMYRACGVPAARGIHATLTLNGKKRGLYFLKEGYDKQFLRDHFGVATGNFYDGGFLKDIDQELQLISGEGDIEKQGDLKALVEAAREKDEKLRFEKMEKLLDMDRFITYLVLQSITWDWDGYPMNRNNYRIYHNPKVDKLIFIPSGMDQMFVTPNGPIVTHHQGLVSAALMKTKEGKKRYYARMREIMDKEFLPERWIKRLDELEEVVQPALAEVDAGAGRDYKHHVNRIRVAIRQRANSINEQLKRVPAEK